MEFSRDLSSKGMASNKSDESKTRVIFILGATATGKSKLAISLATQFSGEIINSDKIQVHDALPVITNRVSEAELSAAPHHLLAFVPPHVDFSSSEFTRAVLESISSIISHNNVPIIAGGSISFVEALLEDAEFRQSHEPCFIWLDVESNVLDRFHSARVDKMVQEGLVGEARSVFDLENNDYTVGVRRAIGVPELDKYFRAEKAGAEKEELESLLSMALEDVKANTSNLARKQVEKIRRLMNSTIGTYPVLRIDPTKFFMKKLEGSLSIEEEEVVWEQILLVPSQNILNAFLRCKSIDDHNTDPDANTGTVTEKMVDDHDTDTGTVIEKMVDDHDTDANTGTVIDKMVDDHDTCTDANTGTVIEKMVELDATKRSEDEGCVFKEEMLMKVNECVEYKLTESV